MFRKRIIITLAAAATLGLATLAPGPASAHRGGGGHHWGGFHHVGAFHMAFHHRFFFRRHFARIRGPIFLTDGCLRVHWVRTHWGWRRRHVWVCG